MSWIATRDGHRLHVRMLGRGEPVVLLHGFASNASHWLPNVWPHRRRFRFILPDLRGFGGSHRVPIDETDVFGQYARDLQDVLDGFRLSRVTLGGISTGALVCLVYNREYGFERVGKYLNIDQAPQTRNGEDWQHGLFGEHQREVFAEFQGLLEMAREAGPDTPYRELPEFVRVSLRRSFTRMLGRCVRHPAWRATIAAAGRVGEPVLAGTLFPVERWYTYLQVMRGFMEGRETRPGLRNITVPTTLMVGMRSRLYPPAGQLFMADQIPRSRVIRFHRSGHVPQLDQPLRFQRAFTRFLLSPGDGP